MFANQQLRLRKLQDIKLLLDIMNFRGGYLVR